VAVSRMLVFWKRDHSGLSYLHAPMTANLPGIEAETSAPLGLKPPPVPLIKTLSAGTKRKPVDRCNISRLYGNVWCRIFTPAGKLMTNPEWDRCWLEKVLRSAERGACEARACGVTLHRRLRRKGSAGPDHRACSCAYPTVSRRSRQTGS